jgi:hypothetical protein
MRILRISLWCWNFEVISSDAGSVIQTETAENFGSFSTRKRTSGRHIGKTSRVIRKNFWRLVAHLYLGKFAKLHHFISNGSGDIARKLACAGVILPAQSAMMVNG